MLATIPWLIVQWLFCRVFNVDPRPWRLIWGFVHLFLWPISLRKPVRSSLWKDLPPPPFPKQKNTHPKWWKRIEIHSHLDPRFPWLALIGEIGPFSTRVVWQRRHSGRRSRSPGSKLRRGSKGRFEKDDPHWKPLFFQNLYSTSQFNEPTCLLAVDWENKSSTCQY